MLIEGCVCDKPQRPPALGPSGATEQGTLTRAASAAVGVLRQWVHCSSAVYDHLFGRQSGHHNKIMCLGGGAVGLGRLRSELTDLRAPANMITTNAAAASAAPASSSASAAAADSKDVSIEDFTALSDLLHRELSNGYDLFLVKKKQWERRLGETAVLLVQFDSSQHAKDAKDAIEQKQNTALLPNPRCTRRCRCATRCPTFRPLHSGSCSKTAKCPRPTL